MKFKDFKKEIKKEEISTPDIKEKINTEYEGEPSKKRFRLPLFFKIAIPTMAAIVVSLVVVLSIINNGNKTPVLSQSSTKLTLYKSKKELNNNVSYENSDNNGIISIFDWQLLSKQKSAIVYETNADLQYSATPGSATDSAPNDVVDEISKTNTQFENVDEADIVKADSKNIYRVSNGKLLINSIDSGNIGETKTLTIVSGKNNKLFDTEMYLTDKYVIVVTTLYEYDEVQEDEYGYFYYRHSNYTVYTIVNVYDIDEAKLVKSFKGNGSLVDSRIILNEDTNLNTLYFIYIESIRKNNKECELPSINIDNDIVTTPYNEIYYSNDCINKAYTHFVSIKLDDTLVSKQIVQTGPYYYNTIYVDGNSIYLVSNVYKRDMELLIKNRINCYYNLESIIKYNINDGDITPIATLLVSGQILNQFAMDEKDGYLRLALAETNHNKIEIYNLVDNEFKLVGSITEGLGEENEIIKSARFNDDTCLVVTAKNTDPLYKIDLSDPTNPKIIGKFKEDGFNTYLQYLTDELEGYAFAVGYNTEDISDYYNVRTGTKFDLYNIKGDNPVEIDEVNYETTYIDAIDNHKAIFVYKNYIGFEVKHTYYLYEIVDGDEDLTLKEVIKKEYNLVSPSEDLNWLYEGDYPVTESRMYYVNGYFYLVYQTASNSTCNYYGIYETNIVSYNLSFEEVDTKN